MHSTLTESGKTNTDPTQRLFDRYHLQLGSNYKDTNGEYDASCLDIAVDLADSMIHSGGSPSYVKFLPNEGTAPYLRPRVYGGKVEWRNHVAIMDEIGDILDPILSLPIPLDEYVEQEFVDDNVIVVGIIAGEEAKAVTAAKIRLRQLGVD